MKLIEKYWQDKENFAEQISINFEGFD